MRPFRDDDEAAHEHVTEHMGDLGERFLHEGGFSYEDVTAQDELQWTDHQHKEKTQRQNTKKTMEEDKWMRTQNLEDVCEEKNRLTSLEQPSIPPANTSPDTTQQETKEDHDDKRRRIDESESRVPTAAQDEVLAPCPVTFVSDTRDDEIAVDVPLLEETVEMSGENSQGWITEEAFFTVSLGARQVRQRNEFLKSMEVEWQTLLKNQAAEVLFLEGWPDRAMDTRWALTWKPYDSKPPGRRAKARLIIKGFTEADLPDIESHSPTFTREGFMTVLQSVCTSCSLGMYSRRSTLETRSSENNHSSSECRLMESQESLVVFGCS